MSVASAATARELAERFLDDIRPDDEVELVTIEPVEYPTCWVVGYNTRAFLETGSIRDSLLGNGPVIVNRRTGVARIALSAPPAEEQLDVD